MTMSNRLRAAIEKIQTGLHKEHNYRLIYECLKVNSLYITFGANANPCLFI